MGNTKLIISGNEVDKDVVFHANEAELQELKKYFDAQKDKGVNNDEIVEELLSLGWAQSELRSIIPEELKSYFKKKKKKIIEYILGFIIYVLLGGVLSQVIKREIIQVILIIPASFIAFKLISIHTKEDQISIIERRIILFFNRFDKFFSINGFSEKNGFFDQIRTRNKKKIFLPLKDHSSFKVFGGYGKYKDKNFYIFIAKKYSHSVGQYNTPVYKYFIFYEFEIRSVPFYYSIVSENHFEPQSRRLQNLNLKEGDFKDMDFPAREFNINWKLRGSDKKMAYQVFDPHMKSLILQINKKDFIGLEISDQSVILSNRFTYHAIQRCPDDFKLLYEIAKQVERNYRVVRWED